MVTAIKEAVGKKGKNQIDDVKFVQQRLNVYVQAKLLGARTPLTIDGDWVPTVPYIEDFQRLVLGRGNPDGKVDPLPGTSMTQLMKDPTPGAAALVEAHGLAVENMARGPIGGINVDVWNAALKALIRFCNHPKLTRPHLLTVIDFRISRQQERMWVFDLKTQTRLYHTWVAHGSGPKNEKGKLVNPQGDHPHHFEDGMKYSSLGAYITQGTFLTNLGHLSQKPTLKVIGLEIGINARSQERGVYFHGASYVKPKSVHNSWGCFASPASVNPELVNAIKGDSFVFAYHSSYHPPV
ncbi:MAG TPA: murein L,D-transpeptidase catalytic domain family protein [Gemmatales bacterium]|nr:murein L,D-transpeptidase catalytic domain family protein [Gemmatales bacterium]